MRLLLSAYRGPHPGQFSVVDEIFILALKPDIAMAIVKHVLSNSELFKWQLPYILLEK